MRIPTVGSALLLATAVACQRTPSREQAPTPTPTPAGLRPLTSRDGARESLPPDAMPAVPTGHPQLPPGHPQLSPGHPQLPPGHPLAEGAPEPAAPASSGSVSGMVDLPARLRGRHSAGDALFIIARSASTGQILAVRKEQNVRFPFDFGISGNDAMVAGTPFVGPVDITARLSRSGDAMPASGDIEGSVKGVAIGASKVQITLDSIRP